MSNYQRLPGAEDSEISFSKCRVEYRQSTRVLWGKVTIGFFLGFLLGLIIPGAQFSYTSWRVQYKNYSPGEGLPLIVTPGDTPVVFAHNETFALEPSEESNAAWESIIPDGMGFVQHQALGPEIAGLSFVHQLHCVQRIREGYYSALNGSGETSGSIHHVKHCFEYLRQALMCHGDTNIEYREVKEDTGEIGTSGWTLHHCRNYNELHDFAEKWKVWKGKARPEQERITDEENIPERMINYNYVSSMCPSDESCCLANSPEERESMERGRCSFE